MIIIKSYLRVQYFRTVHYAPYLLPYGIPKSTMCQLKIDPLEMKKRGVSVAFHIISVITILQCGVYIHQKG